MLFGAAAHHRRNKAPAAGATTVLVPISFTPGASLSNGDLTITIVGSPDGLENGFAKSSALSENAKAVFEVLIEELQGEAIIAVGFGDPTTENSAAVQSMGIAFLYGDTSPTIIPAFGPGDYVTAWIDTVAQTCGFAINGIEVAAGAAPPVFDATVGTGTFGEATASATANFGQEPFVMNPLPAGYQAWG